MRLTNGGASAVSALAVINQRNSFFGLIPGGASFALLMAGVLAKIQYVKMRAADGGNGDAGKKQWGSMRCRSGTGSRNKNGGWREEQRRGRRGFEGVEGRKEELRIERDNLCDGKVTTPGRRMV